MQHHFHFHLYHHARHHARYDVDMTQGSTTRHLINFALPLLAGNLFQQLYNMVDTWVVGNFVSNEAFSAVGTVTPIINTLIGFFLGMSSGAGVVISQYYGAHRPEKVHEAVHTAMLLTIVMGVVFTGVGIAMTPLMLELMKTPAEVAPDQTVYLTIYFAGIMGLLLYNMGSGILRAVGDSRRPFYFLLVSAGMNTALDLLFVLKFGMGVEGVAYATIIAQAVSAVLTIAVLMRYDGSVKLSLRKLRIHWDMLKKIVAVGIPAALQMAITAFSNVFVQGYINHFGADCMSGWTAYTKIDQLVILPVQSLSMASTTFVGQNLGVGNVARAKGGVRRALRLSFAVAIITEERIFFPSRVLNHAIHNFTPMESTNAPRVSQRNCTASGWMIFSTEFRSSSKPIRAIMTAITSEVRYSMRPCPNGCPLSAGFAASLYPNMVIRQLAQSDRLLNASDTMAMEWESEPITYFSRNNTTLQQIPTTLLNVP